MKTTGYRERVLNLVRDERARQDDKFANVNHLITMGFGSSVQPYPWLKPFVGSSSGDIEAAFRDDYVEYENLHGYPTWMHLIREEVAELFDTRTSSRAIEEAVQVAALCVSLCEELIAQHEGDQTVSDLGISDANRMLLYRAYDDGEGNTINLKPDGDGWFLGLWSDDPVMEGTEIDGTLYSIVPMSGNGIVSVLVGRQIVDNHVGPVFTTSAEARAYVQGLTAK